MRFLGPLPFLPALALLMALPVTPARAQEDPRLLDALRLAQEGRSDSARARVNQLLQATPTTDTLYPQMLYTLGLVSGNLPEMRRLYSRVAVEHPFSSYADDALYRLALLDYAAGSFPEAVRQLEQLAGDYPDSPLLGPGSEWAARAYFDQKRPRDGCRWLTLGLPRAGDDVELKNRLEYLNALCHAGRGHGEGTGREPKPRRQARRLRSADRCRERAGDGREARCGPQEHVDDRLHRTGWLAVQGARGPLRRPHRRRPGPGEAQGALWWFAVRGQGTVTGKQADAAGTPLMQQYREIKARHQDAILFFRMGDFYEMFFEDAQLAARVLGITLTSVATAYPSPACR
jgi:hypothetical protein